MVFFKLLRQSPWSARIGLAMVLLNVFAAIFTPYIAPYTETEIVGDVWLPMSSRPSGWEPTTWDGICSPG